MLNNRGLEQIQADTDGGKDCGGATIDSAGDRPVATRLSIIQNRRYPKDQGDHDQKEGN